MAPTRLSSPSGRLSYRSNVQSISKRVANRESNNNNPAALYEDIAGQCQTRAFWRQAGAVTALNLAQLTIGFGLGFSATFVPFAKEYGIGSSKRINHAEIALMVAMVSVGQVLGGLAVGALGASLGRKNTVLASCLPNFVGWVVLFSLPSLEFAILGRFLTGIGMGMEGAIHSVYVCELVSPRWRGSMTASGIVVITSGILAAYLVGTVLYWRTAAVTFCAFPVVTALAVLFIPESPIYLIEKGRIEKAKRSLHWLGRVDFGVTLQSREATEIESTEEPTMMEKFVMSAKTIFRTETLKPLFVVNTLFTLANFSGFIVVIFYGVTIFQESGSAIDSYHATIILGLVQVTGSLLGSLAVGRFGKKTLLLVSSALCSVSMGLLGLSVWARDHVSVRISGLDWAPLVCLIIFTLSNTLGLGCVPWVLMGELFPDDTRSFCAGLTGALCFSTLFVAGLTFPLLSDVDHGILGLSGTFWLYSAFCGLCFLFSMAFVPQRSAENDETRVEGMEMVEQNTHIEAEQSGRQETPEDFTDLTVELQGTPEACQTDELGGKVNPGFEIEPAQRVSIPAPLFPKAAVPPNDPLVKYLKVVIAETASVDSGSVDKPVHKESTVAEPVLPPYLSPPLSVAASVIGAEARGSAGAILDTDSKDNNQDEIVITDAQKRVHEKFPRFAEL